MADLDILRETLSELAKCNDLPKSVQDNIADGYENWQSSDALVALAEQALENGTIPEETVDQYRAGAESIFARLTSEINELDQDAANELLGVIGISQPKEIEVAPAIAPSVAPPFDFN